MTTRTARWELLARTDGAVLRRTGTEGRPAVDPAALPLSEQLVHALQEWASAARSVAELDPDSTDVTIANQRGKRLAARVASELGTEVDYVAPGSGEVSTIVSGPASPDEPTPWVPGLVVSGVLGTIVAVILVAVTLGLADVNVVLGVVVNLAVAAGFAPSVWLGRAVPVWRWVAWGTGGGVLAAWAALLLSLLGA